MAKIKQPANTGVLNWSVRFAIKHSERFQKAQRFIDNEVLRLDDPLTPKKTGNLINSGKLGTVAGSGEVNYLAPYAARQYYDTAESRWYNPNRGAHWFERMKTAHKDEILSGAAKYANGG